MHTAVSKSAFIVRVPEAEAHVGMLRARFDPWLLPAHITALMPFMAMEQITSSIIDRAQTALNTLSAFSFALARVGRFPATAFLAPEPAEPFIGLTKTLMHSFPDYPPYLGAYTSIIPHLTVADGSAADAEFVAQELECMLGAHGSIYSACVSVALLENSTGHWREMHSFRLPRSSD